MKMPVVGTRLAFAGLTSSEGEACFMADEPEIFASRVCQLLEKEDLAHDLGCRGRQMVRSSFSWEAFGHLYDEIYDNILHGSS